jgi:predicted aspartyl protease
VTLPILSGFGLPVVSAEVDGRRANLLLDTGASAPLVYSARRLGVANNTWKSIDTICLGGMCFENVQTRAQDTPFSTDDPDDVQGFVGTAILSHLVFEIAALETVTLKYRQAACQGQAYTVSLDENRRPFIHVSIDDQVLPEPVLLDTGAQYTVLGSETVQMLDSYDREGEQPTSVCTVNGCSTEGTFISSVQRVCVGERCTNDVAVKYPAWDAVGCTFFENFSLAFDLAHDRLVFCQ